MACGHYFCRDCLQAYVTVKVNEGQVLGLRCPHVDDEDVGVATGVAAGAAAGAAPGWVCEACTLRNDDNATECVACGSARPRRIEEAADPHAEPGCAEVVTEDVLRSLLGLDEELIGRFSRYLSAKTNDRYRECPECQEPNTDGPTARSNQLTCSKCRASFCFVHANAHPGMGCRQYERRQRREELLNRRAVEELTRRCPGCSTPVEKAGGCNHLTCPQCRQHFVRTCRTDSNSSHICPRLPATSR